MSSPSALRHSSPDAPSGALRRHAQRPASAISTPHMLRHTFGTTLADRNVPIERIRELMGHAHHHLPALYLRQQRAQARGGERLDQRPASCAGSPASATAVPLLQPALHPPALSTSLMRVGRPELRRLQANPDKRVATPLGPTGVGKSHLLAQLSGERLIRLVRLSLPKQALLEIAEALHSQGVFNPTTRRLPASGGEPEPPERRTGPVVGSAGREAPQEDF